MRQINELIIHCTATPATQSVTVADITRWHRQRGWKTIGYHFLIDQDGVVHTGRPLSDVGAHCRGHNANSIGICYVGGLAKNGSPSDTRTDAQKNALLSLVTELLERFPSAKVYGHNEFSSKACPCFDVQAWRKEAIWN